MRYKGQGHRRESCSSVLLSLRSPSLSQSKSIQLSPMSTDFSMCLTLSSARASSVGNWRFLSLGNGCMPVNNYTPVLQSHTLHNKLTHMHCKTRSVRRKNLLYERADVYFIKTYIIVQPTNSNLGYLQRYSTLSDQ